MDYLEAARRIFDAMALLEDIPKMYPHVDELLTKAYTALDTANVELLATHEYVQLLRDDLPLEE